MRSVFEFSSFLSVPPEDAWAFHERPDALPLLTPEGFPVEVLERASTLAPSQDVVRARTRFLGVPLSLEFVHTLAEPPHMFVDEQLRGPFSSWKHEHHLTRGGWERDPATRLLDRIELEHPLMPLARPFVASRFRKLFAHRHRVTRRELAPAASKFAGRRIVVTGATGLIGARLVEILLEKGCDVTVLARDPGAATRLFDGHVDAVRWDAEDPTDDGWRTRLDGAHAVVHLAGTPLFGRRWSDAFKQRIEASRVESTRLLVAALEDASPRPTALVTASAVGYYGTAPERLADERAQPADDFLARVCVGWEREARAAQQHGVRDVQIRVGFVLARRAGGLAAMLPLFRLGGGGVLGQPLPWLNWIHLEDVARIFAMAVFHDDMSGPFNAVAPHPATNRTFALALARVLRRPALFRYPRWFTKLLLGEAAHYASGGARARGDRVREAGYQLFFTELEPALREVLGKPRR